MRHSRLAVLVFGSALAVGGFASTALARTDDPSTPSPTASTEVETHTPATGGTVTLTVAGVGTVTLSVDPATAAISDVVVTPIDGVTTGAPVATPEGVKIQVTAADGTVRVLQIKARHEDAGLEVETELEVENGNDPAAENHDLGDDHGNDQGQPEGENRGPGNAQGAPQDQHGRDDGPGHDSTVTTAGTPGVFSPGTAGPSGDDHGGDAGRGGPGGGDSGGGHSGGRD